MPRARNTEEKSAAEQLLDAQENAIEDVNNCEDVQPDTVQEASKDAEAVQDLLSNYVVLTGCSSVFTHGIRFEKGVPVQVEDPSLLDYLKQSGLFV